MKKQKTKNYTESEMCASVKKDTIVIIGNGFDRWQGLETGYDRFQEYYLKHRDEIMRKLHIQKKKIEYDDGSITEISDVELIYGDPFDPDELENCFWSNFEASLSEIDDQQLNWFFGKERGELREMKRSIKNAKRILTQAFCDWIASIKVDEKRPEYEFGENCVIINFNYTDTLPKRFKISPASEYHIHGEAKDKSSIIFGHSSHPEYPMEELYSFGGRFRGAFFVDLLLYETDKHVQDNIQELAMFMALHSIMPEDIKHVYVLGHSMSPVDIEYFIFLASVTTVKTNTQEKNSNIESDDPIQDLMSQMEYTLSRRDRTLQGIEPNEQQLDAVQRRFVAEQEERNKMMQKMFLKELGFKGKISEAETVIPAPKSRTEDATWHISCYGPKDQQWVDFVMKELGCTNYATYKTIDECISNFKI